METARGSGMFKLLTTRTPARIVSRVDLGPIIASVSAIVFLGFSGTELEAANRWASFQNGGQTRIVEPGKLPLKWSMDKGIVWAAELGGYGQSTPVVWSDQVIVTFTSGGMKQKLHIRALELATGKLAWEHTSENSTPEKSSNYVSRAAPSPVADNDGVNAFFEGGNLIGLNHQGKVRWERDLVKDYGPIKARHGLASSLEQNNEHVFVWVERTQEPFILAVSKKTGKTTWKVAGVGKTAWSSPRLVNVDGRPQLVLSAIGRIIGLDPSSGTRLWEFEDVANNTTPTPMPLGGGRFLLGASEGRGQGSVGPKKSCGVIEISKKENGSFAAKYVWRAAKATSSFGSPIVAGDNAYFVSRSGVVYCLNAKTGKQRYAKRSAGSVWATPMHIGNRIYLFGRNGTTTVIGDGNKFEVLAQNTLWALDPPKPAPAAEGGRGAPPSFGGPVLYAVAVAGDKFLLRRGDRLYCVSE